MSEEESCGEEVSEGERREDIRVEIAHLHHALGGLGQAEGQLATRQHGRHPPKALWACPNGERRGKKVSEGERR